MRALARCNCALKRLVRALKRLEPHAKAAEDCAGAHYGAKKTGNVSLQAWAG